MTKLTEERFQSLLRRAKQLTGDYGRGYERGLRRAFHGELFGTLEEHEKWLSLGTDGDYRLELGRGYRDGLAASDPDVIMGRPPLPPDVPRSNKQPRTIRLDDERWGKLKRLGTEWLERQIDRAPTPPAENG